MIGTKISVEGVHADLPTEIIPKIEVEPTIKVLIKLNQLISGNAASIALKIGGGRHVHLALTMTAADHMSQRGYVFLPPHNPGYYPPIKGTTQEQALGTERFQKFQHFSEYAPPWTEH